MIRRKAVSDLPPWIRRHECAAGPDEWRHRGCALGSADFATGLARLGPWRQPIVRLLHSTAWKSCEQLAYRGDAAGPSGIVAGVTATAPARLGGKTSQESDISLSVVARTCQNRRESLLQLFEASAPLQRESVMRRKARHRLKANSYKTTLSSR